MKSKYESKLAKNHFNCQHERRNVKGCPVCADRKAEDKPEPKRRPIAIISRWDGKRMALPHGPTRRGFSSKDAAANFIDKVLRPKDRVGVERGDYSLDWPCYGFKRTQFGVKEVSRANS